jgi:hypothetical protein
MSREHSRLTDKQDCENLTGEFDTGADDVELPPEMSGYTNRELLRQQSAILAAVTEQLGSLRPDNHDTLYLSKRLYRTTMERWKRLCYHQMCAETRRPMGVEGTQHSPIPATVHSQGQETESILDFQTRRSSPRSPIGWADKAHQPPSVGHLPLATGNVNPFNKVIDLKSGSHFPSIPPVIGSDETRSSGSSTCLYNCPYCDELISSDGPLNKGPWACVIRRIYLRS